MTDLLETLRVLKNGGTFAIHDLMSKARYGDMEAFVQRLKDLDYEDARLIDTTRGLFMNRTQAVLFSYIRLEASHRKEVGKTVCLTADLQKCVRKAGNIS